MQLRNHRACGVLFSDAEGREDAGEHVFGGRFARDLAEISESVVQADEYDLLAVMLFKQLDRVTNFISRTNKQIVMARVGDEKAVR